MSRLARSVLAPWLALDLGRRAVVVAASALLVAIAVATGSTLDRGRDHAIDGMLARDEQTALRLATGTTETLDEIERSLRLLVYVANETGRLDLHALAGADLIATRTTRSILITDPAGTVVDSTTTGVPMNVADEDDFKAVRASAGDGLRIGRPARDALSGDWSIPVWRRIVQPDGRFGGVVLANVDPAALIGSAIRAESPRSVVAIIGNDGVFRARLAGDGTLTVGMEADVQLALRRAREVRQDRVAMQSPVDGTARFLSAVEVRRYPLHAFVATEAETALPAHTAGRGVALRWMAMLVALVLGSAVLLWIAMGRAEANRRAAQRADRDFRAAIEGSLDAVTVLATVRGPDGRIADMTVTDINSRAAGMIGEPRERLIGRRITEVMPRIEDEGFLRAAAVAIRDRRTVSGEVLSTDPRLAGRWMHHEVVPLESGAALIVRDVTDAREQARRLDALARFDSLTGLPNRRHFEESLTQARARALRSGQALVLLYVDLDGFKAVNDTLGHEGGDLLLQGVSLRLLECVRATDLVARLGGDEFAILLEAAGSEEQIREICGRVVESLSHEHRIDGHPAWATPSIGAVVLAGDESEESLRRRADEAMYEAKRAGKGRYCLVTEPVARDEPVTIL